jgi:hypothetical protein
MKKTTITELKRPEAMNDPRPQTPQNGGLFQNFLGGILDFRFRRNLTMQLLPLVYIVLLLGAAGVILLILVVAFWVSPLAGLVALVVAPFAFLAAAAVIRAALEYLVMAYRIMETVQEMKGIPGQVHYLSTEFEQIAAEVHHIRAQVDSVTEVVQDLQPLLHTVSLPGRLLRGLHKSGPKRQQIDPRQD